MNTYLCPSCGFLVFSEPPGSYDICGICSWQDDGVQLANPSSGGGANGMSLAESQEAALAEFPFTVKNAPDGTARSGVWRPLHPLEIELHQQEVSEKRTLWPRKAIDEPEKCYWNSFFAYLGNPEYGWMEVLIRHPEANLDFAASHVPDDSVKLLVKALYSLLGGESKAEVVWNLEPVKYEFGFNKKDEDTLVFQVVDRNSHRKIILEMYSTLPKIVLPFFHALSRLAKLDEMGEYEGDMRWTHLFPVDEFTDLTERAGTLIK